MCPTASWLPRVPDSPESYRINDAPDQVRHEQERLVVTNPGDATHPHDRLTFTFPAIAQAELAVFTVAGADKRDALSRVRAGDDLPAAHVTAQRVIWLVDPAAMGSRNT